jgi:hypothetical protein
MSPTSIDQQTTLAVIASDLGIAADALHIEAMVQGAACSVLRAQRHDALRVRNRICLLEPSRSQSDGELGYCASWRKALSTTKGIEMRVFGLFTIGTTA